MNRRPRRRAREKKLGERENFLLFFSLSLLPFFSFSVSLCLRLPFPLFLHLSLRANEILNYISGSFVEKEEQEGKQGKEEGERRGKKN